MFEALAKLRAAEEALAKLRAAEVKVDPVIFWERIMKLHETWNVRQS